MGLILIKFLLLLCVVLYVLYLSNRILKAEAEKNKAVKEAQYYNDKWKYTVKSNIFNTDHKVPPPPTGKSNILEFRRKK